MEVQEAQTATEANAADLWDGLWQDKGQETWRKQALSQVYTRIGRLIPKDARAVDLGGGTGVLAKKLKDTKDCHVTVVDHSAEAIKQCHEKGLLSAQQFMFEAGNEGELSSLIDTDLSEWFFISTEMLEHLTEGTRGGLLRLAAKSAGAFLSVPNDRLGPDEEPQHTIKWNAISFKKYLLGFFEYVRIEAMGPFLLAVCGPPAKKNFKLSVTLPVRDEAEDLEATLASFRAVADEIVVGVDPRTVDNTREVAAKYAEVVFDLVDPEGPEGEKVPAGGVHFSHMRNQCIERCSSEWIFMTEGHERLQTGTDTLICLDKVMPKAAKVGFVLRQGTGQQWGFPWLFRNESKIRFTRPTHNVLDYPPGTYAVQLPEVRTMHERHPDRGAARVEQRKVQNRLSLLEDWMVNENENSLFYLGSEWRSWDEDRATRYLEEYIALPTKNGPMRYHTRLILAKLYAKKKDLKSAREILVGAAGDDWSRTEHWIWLGDIAYNEGRYEEALQFYQYAGVRAGEPPFSFWWVDLSCYSYLPAQRLAMVFTDLGRLTDALHWAQRVTELLPDNAPAEIFEEAETNIGILKEALGNV